VLAAGCIICDLTKLFVWKIFRQRIFWSTCFQYRKKIVVELSHLQIQTTTFHFG